MPGGGAAQRIGMAVDFLSELESCVPGLRRYARSLLRDRDAADDLVQDCLERALGRRRLWRGGASLRPWLFRIMHNIWANEVRRRVTRPAHQPIDWKRSYGANCDTGMGESRRKHSSLAAYGHRASRRLYKTPIVGREGRGPRDG